MSNHVDISKQEAETIADFLGMYVINESAAVLKDLEDFLIDDDELNEEVESFERLMLLRHSLKMDKKTALTAQEAHDLYYALWFGVLDLVKSSFAIDNLYYVRTLGNIMERCEPYSTLKAVEKSAE